MMPLGKRGNFLFIICLITSSIILFYTGGKMKKVLICAVITAVFVLSGCKDHLSPAPVSGNLRLLKTDMQSGTSCLGEEFKYNSDGSFSEIKKCYDAAKTACERSVYSYDAAGRVSAVNTCYGAGTLANSVVNTYDAAGMMSSTSYTSYSFTPSMILNSIYTHAAAGNTIAVTSAGGLSGTGSTFTYDAAGRLLRHNWNNGTYYFGSTCYTYDSAGKIIRDDETKSGGGQHVFHSLYEYDTAGKLTKVNRYSDMPGMGALMGYTEYYYDTFGNISYELYVAADGTLASRKDYTYEATY
jgi:YD repeat-containing protein